MTSYMGSRTVGDLPCMGGSYSIFPLYYPARKSCVPEHLVPDLFSASCAPANISAWFNPNAWLAIYKQNSESLLWSQ